MHRIAYGLLEGARPHARAKLDELHRSFKRTPVDAVLAEDIVLELWEKFVLLATMAAMTGSMRAAVGDILATDEGEALINETLEACRATAAQSRSSAARQGARRSAETLARARLDFHGFDAARYRIRQPGGSVAHRRRHAEARPRGRRRTGSAAVCLRALAGLPGPDRARAPDLSERLWRGVLAILLRGRGFFGSAGSSSRSGMLWAEAVWRGLAIDVQVAVS